MESEGEGLELSSSSAAALLLAPQQQQSPALAVLASDEPSLFREGFYSPSLSHHESAASGPGGLPWKSVREVIAMADNALKAKQRAAERLQKQLESVRQKGGNSDSKLLQRAQRAEVDCGSLLDELQQLIAAKADVAQQRADLDRANSLLMAERELLCEQLQVSPDNVNLCQAVSKVLAAARKAKALDTQLRLLAKCQRELLLQLEAQREATARAERAARQWQAEKQLYVQLLEQHGIKQPELPLELQQQQPSAASPIPGATAAAAGAAGGSVIGGLASSGSLTSSSAALMAHLMLLRTQSNSSGGVSAALQQDQLVGSPHAHLPPGTPPVDDLSPAALASSLAQGTPPAAVATTLPGAVLPLSPPPAGVMRRSHSLDSCLNSLTGLLDQVALGQLCVAGSDEGADALYDTSYEEGGESESTWNMDAMSGDMEMVACGGGSGGVAAVAAGTAAGSSTSSSQAAAAKDAAMQQHQHLQPVFEAAEECC